MNARAETPSFDVDVVLVGLGPTGMTLAHLLGRRGITVLALEREPEFYGNARAVYTDDECMRIFQATGLAKEIEADMLLDCPAQWVFKDGSVLGQFFRTDRPNGWGISNFFYQPALEATLERGLSTVPSVTVMRGREVAYFEQDSEGVNVFHHASSGSGYRPSAPREVDPASKDDALQCIRARFMVGCDGGRSAVRTQLGIKMAGQSFPNPWLVVDIKQKPGESALRHLPYFSFYCDPECPTVSCPQPNGHHRFEFMLMPGQTREYMEDAGTIRTFLARHVDVDKFEILRSLVYTFNALNAEQWRTGRVFLAGDAAHMTPQFMGQGMSSGVRDAYNLAWKLDAVIRGFSSAELLDTYQTERRPHAQEMIDISVKMKDFVSVSNPTKALLRNLVVRGLLAMPLAGTYIREGRFKPPQTYLHGRYVGLPRKRRGASEGRPIPQPLMRTLSGRHALLDDLLGENFAIVGFGVNPRLSFSPQELESWNQFKARFLTVFQLGQRPQGYDGVSRQSDPNVIEIEDIRGELQAWLKNCGARAGYVAVVRPDKFVAALIPAHGLASATAFLMQQLRVTANLKQQALEKIV